VKYLISVILKKYHRIGAQLAPRHNHGGIFDQKLTVVVRPTWRFSGGGEAHVIALALGRRKPYSYATDIGHYTVNSCWLILPILSHFRCSPFLPMYSLCTYASLYSNVLPWNHRCICCRAVVIRINCWRHVADEQHSVENIFLIMLMSLWRSQHPVLCRRQLLQHKTH